MLRCSACKALKPNTAFYPDKSTRGFTYQCRECRCAALRRPTARAASMADNRRGVPPGQQRCSGCKLCKPADGTNFSPAARSRSGLSSRCRECQRDRARRRMRELRSDPATASAVRESKRRHAKSEAGRAKRRLKSQTENHLRRQRQITKPFKWTPEDWASCLAAWDGRCAYCGAEAEQQDHFVPVSSPGFPGTVPWNMVPACGLCNRRKGARDPYEWFANPSGLLRIIAYLDSLRPL